MCIKTFPNIYQKCWCKGTPWCLPEHPWECDLRVYLINKWPGNSDPGEQGNTWRNTAVTLTIQPTAYVADGSLYLGLIGMWLFLGHASGKHSILLASFQKKSYSSVVDFQSVLLDGITEIIWSARLFYHQENWGLGPFTYLLNTSEESVWGLETWLGRSQCLLFLHRAKCISWYPHLVAHNDVQLPSRRSTTLFLASAGPCVHVPYTHTDIHTST